VLSNNELPSRRVWLIVKRTVSDEPEYSFYISNAQKSTRLRTFAWLSGLRWAIEQCFEEAKSIVGMDQYEVRKFRAWHHHMLVCMLAHFFLWHLKIAMGKKAPAITVSQLRRLIATVLPLKNFSPAEMLALVMWIQQRNHKAYLSHRKKLLGS
jgi:SRSO17 transposase